MAYTYKYPRPAVTADSIVITKEVEPKVLLIERGDEPFKGCWAFPGGFMNMDETTQPRVYMKKKLLFSVAIALLMLAGCNSKSEPAKNTSAPSFDEVLTTRRSVRSYDATKKISEAEVRELLLATQEAPSWANQQPTKYYVAISEEKLKAVQDMVGGNKERIKDAPVLIVSTFERGKSGFFQGNQTNEIGDGWGAYDNGLSNCYLVLKARAMGFDTLIMGMRDADALRSLFSIPESETIMAVISLGYRAGEPNRPERRPLDDIVKFY